MRRCGLLLLAFLGAACGDVTSDPSGLAPPDAAPPDAAPPDSPAPATAKSLICPAAPGRYADEIAAWYAGADALTFVHHDGTQQLVHEVDGDARILDLTVQAAGARVMAFVYQSDQTSRLYLFDRRGKPIPAPPVPDESAEPFLGETALAYKVLVGDQYEGRIWDGSSTRSMGKYVAIAPPRADGWVAVQDGWDNDAQSGFYGPAGEYVGFSNSGHPYPVAGRLLAVDSQARKIRIGSPEGVTEIPLGDFGLSDPNSIGIRQVREEGWATITQSSGNTWAPSSLVVNLIAGSVELVNGEPKPQQPLSMYCDDSDPGYLTADGSVIQTHRQNGEFQLMRAGNPIGQALSGIAYLSLSERAGTVVVLGSDGSDLFCGPPPSPAAPDSLAGNSVQVVHAGVARLAEYGSTLDAPRIHSSGACTLNQLSSSSSASSLDLESGTSLEIPLSSPGRVSWLE